ncbi:MBL fold metallo-hydrolase [Candidatus Amesbacteria bacterium]|nr:MBL fold metallo-hydrolase [Candidatus Amesbacteria bacterium]
MGRDLATVIVLKSGYARWEGYASQKACGSITLVKSHLNCLVDLGLPENIDFVILTHSDIDHIGNLNLFPQATFIGGNDVITGDHFKEFFKDKYQVDENIQVMHTPGHDNRSVSVLVKTAKGIVAVTGDIFKVDKSINLL